MSIEAVIHSFSFNLEFLCEQVSDVSEDQMVAQPNGIANHPAWVLGHLTFSCQAIGCEIGLDEWLPETWAAMYGTGSVPQPDRVCYPPTRESLFSLERARNKVTQAVRRLSDRELDQPLPDESFRKVLPTVRHAVTQILVAHTANHVGQITLWRNAMQLPRISRPFL